MDNEAKLDIFNTNKIYDDCNKQLDSINAEYTNDVENLDKSQAIKEDTINKYYEDDTNKANEDIKRLENLKAKLNNNIANINKAYDVLDNSLADKRKQLEELFKAKLNKINEHYDQMIEESKHASDSDILDGNIIDIFKKK